MKTLKKIFSTILVYVLATSLAFPISLFAADSEGMKQFKTLLERQDPTAETYNTALRIRDESKDPIKIKIAKASLEHLNNFRPGALYEAQTFKGAAARFPMETMIFYSMIFMSSLSQGLFSGDINDPAPLDTIKHTLTDPIGYLGFFSFVMMSTATQKAGGELVRLTNKLAQEYYLELAREVKNIEKKSSSHKLSSKNKIYNAPAKFKISNTIAKGIIASLGPLGMSFGMFASQNVEQLFHDEDLAACAARWTKYIKGGSEPENFMAHCERTYKKWFAADKLERLWPSMVGMVASSSLAHMILGFATSAIRKMAPKNKATEIIFAGLDLKRTSSIMKTVSKIPGLRWLPPFHYTWGGLAFQAGTLWLFMSIDEAYMSEWFTIPVTDWVAKGQIKDNGIAISNEIEMLRQASWKDGKNDPLLKCAPGKYISTCFERVWGNSVSDDLRAFSDTLLSYRQNRLAKAMMANQSWLKFMQEYVTTYQSAYRVYDRFFLELEKNNVTPNSLLTMDYLRGVKIEVPGIGLMPIRTINEPIGIGVTYESLLTDANGALTPNDIKAILLSERYKSILRAKAKIESWLAPLKITSHDKENLLRVADYFEFADTSKDIETLLLKQKKKVTDSKLTSQYQAAIDELKSAKDRNIREYNRRGYEIAKGIREIEINLIKTARYECEQDDLQSALCFQNIYRILLDDLGQLDVPSMPGEQIITELVNDLGSIEPESEKLHPKSIGIASTPNLIEYLVTSMACGPEVLYTGPLKLDPKMSIEEMGDAVEDATKLVRKPLWDKIFFTPPRVVETKDGKTVCRQRYTSGKTMNPLTEVVFNTDTLENSEKHLGILNYIGAHVNPKLLGHTGNDRNFFLWWDKHMGSVTKEIFTYLRAKFQNMLDEDFFPNISNDEIIKDGLGELDLPRGVVESVLSEANIYLSLVYLNLHDTEKFEGKLEFKQVLDRLCEKDKIPAASEDQKRVSEFLSGVVSKFEISRDFIRQMSQKRSIGEVQEILTKFIENQKALEDQLVAFAQLTLGPDFNHKTVKLPVIHVGNPKHYLELGLRTLLDLRGELSSYGRMAGLMAISFYDKK